MTQQSLIHDADTPCGWCLTKHATTMLYTVPTCGDCASCKPRDRVDRWLAAVERRRQHQESR